jgi:hypothetical protein
MATLTVSLTGLTSISKTLSAGDLTKLINAFTPVLQDQGIPSPTNQQIFDYWVNRWKADTIAFVMNREKSVADQTITPITLT